MNVDTEIEPLAAKAASASGRRPRAAWLESIYGLVDVLSSLRLTVVLLCLAVVLVFIGTLAQREEGLYAAQNRYFRSLLIWWTPAGGHWKVPVFPGGNL